jgi:hypothetical protein
MLKGTGTHQTSTMLFFKLGNTGMLLCAKNESFSYTGIIKKKLNQNPCVEAVPTCVMR